MIKFCGNVVGGEGTNYYQCSNTAYHFGRNHECGGWSVDLINGYVSNRNHVSHDSVMTWGFDGYGSGLLAIHMLGLSMCPDWFNIKVVVDPSRIPCRDLVLKHYRAFTEEIVANLPDSWTMTSDEVLAWLKKKEQNAVV